MNLHRESFLCIALSTVLLVGEVTGLRAKPTGATVRSADASMLARSKEDKPWRVMKKGDAIEENDLILGMPGAKIATKAVEMKLLSDLNNASPYPILESAIRVHRNNKVDLDLTLERGRVDLVNRKKKGAATVHLRFYDQRWDLTLESPGTRVALEYFGRWPRGSNFKVKLKKGEKHEPTLYLVIVALRGSLIRSCPDCEYELKAPPGPALFAWDNISGRDDRAQKLNKLPAWVDAKPKTEEAIQRKKALEELRQTVLKQGIVASLEKLVDSEKPYLRRLGIIGAAATDNLQLVVSTLLKGKHPDAWDHAVVAIRHWIGREPGQDRKLYQRLLEKRKLKPAHAQIILKLLHGFSDFEMAQPETYEILIDYLDHDVVGIRGLANWHLQRLVPSVKIPFNPVGSKEQHKIARDRWKKVIPEGKLPPGNGKNR